MKAQYQCMKCGYGWLSEAGPTQCPQCHHLYVDWINWEDFQNKLIEEMKYNV